MDQQDHRIGTIIDGRYELLTPLGEGGMGTVYKARHVLLGKIMALKILRDAQDQQAAERFRREAKAASSIEHENIVAITDFGVLPDNRPYLVMEFLQGPTLADVVGKGPLGTVRALQIALQVARGLAAVHDQGIIHRDLKPDNVFVLGRQGQDLIKIVDFGLAHVAQSTRLTAHGMVMGTPSYISPEQASGRPLDARCDQYALGCILYEMLTGTLPFTDKSPAVVMKQHVMDFPPAMRERRPDLGIPEQMEALVTRLLLKKPEQRFASTHDLEDVLQQELDRLLQAPTSRPSMGARLSRVRALLVGVVAAVACFGLLLGYLQSTKKRRRAATQSPVELSVTRGPAPPGLLVPDEAAEKHAPPARGPSLDVHFAVARPAREVTLSCTPGIRQQCRKNCTLTVPPGEGQCIASAQGFGSQAFTYGQLRDRAGKDRRSVKQKVALVPIR